MLMMLWLLLLLLLLVLLLLKLRAFVLLKLESFTLRQLQSHVERLLTATWLLVSIVAGVGKHREIIIVRAHLVDIGIQAEGSQMTLPNRE
jgi:hypothetical protein